MVVSFVFFNLTQGHIFIVFRARGRGGAGGETAIQEKTSIGCLLYAPKGDQTCNLARCVLRSGTKPATFRFTGWYSNQLNWCFLLFLFLRGKSSLPRSWESGMVAVMLLLTPPCKWLLQSSFSRWRAKLFALLVFLRGPSQGLCFPGWVVQDAEVVVPQFSHSQDKGKRKLSWPYATMEYCYFISHWNSRLPLLVLRCTLLDILN